MTDSFYFQLGNIKVNAYTQPIRCLMNMNRRQVNVLPATNAAAATDQVSAVDAQMAVWMDDETGVGRIAAATQ